MYVIAILLSMEVVEDSLPDRATCETSLGHQRGYRLEIPRSSSKKSRILRIARSRTGLVSWSD
jgi:hypothetical protein